MQSNYRSPAGNARPMSDQQIMQYAPSVFATEKHENRGERYQFISSAEIVSGLRDQGFLPVRVQQSRANDEGKRAHTKHIVTFRQAEDMDRLSTTMQLGGHRRINETVNEIVLYNSHDGTSSYQLHAGKFRLVCTNGLIVADSMLASVRVPHFGRQVLERVVEGAFHVISQMPIVDQVIEAWRGLELPRAEQLLLADAAMDLRWDETERPGNMQPAEVLAARRTADAGSDLWSTFNRIQEALLNGGTKYRTAKHEVRSTREVGSVQEKMRINKSLWKLTAHMAELHGLAMPETNVIEGEVVA